MSKSSIEWTQETWNPLAGCKEISPGCERCYAAPFAHRLAAMGQKKYAGTTKKIPNGKIAWTGKINLDPGALSIPIGRKKPTMYFVNSMSDLFHEGVPDEFIDRVFAVMALCPQHTFQMLTKRPERMAPYCDSPNLGNRIYQQVSRWLDEGDSGFLGGQWDRVHLQAGTDTTDGPPQYDWVQWQLPLPNVWLGVSVESQKYADERIPLLLQTPAAVRFLSCEPLLEAVDLSRYLGPRCQICGETATCFGAYEGKEPGYGCNRCCGHGNEDGWCEPVSEGGISDSTRGIDWVIVGGESGPGARPMQIEWVRTIRDQCVVADVPFHFKQWGGTNKKTAGRVLDGRTWDEFPEAKAVPA